MAIASFVLGIIGVLTAVLIVPGLICGIVGLVLGLTSRGNAKRGGAPATWQATAGAILSGLAILAVVGIFIAAAAS
jgi:hypothetical protein